MLSWSGWQRLSLKSDAVRFQTEMDLFSGIHEIFLQNQTHSTPQSLIFEHNTGRLPVHGCSPCPGMTSPHSLVPGGGGGGGGYSVRKLMGCAAGHWKLDPKRSREKWNLGPKRLNSVRIGSFSTPKDRFGIRGWEKVPQKDRVQSPECQKRGSKRRHIHITQHRVSTLPGSLVHQ